jgi:adenylate kinase family enzyme
MPPTILDIYLEKYKQLIIVISGMSGSNKSEIADEISRSLKCKHINQNNFLNPDFEETIEINNKKINIWDSDDAIDWLSFNNKIKEMLNENKILVLSGVSFNKEKIDFKIDFHIHLKLSKQLLLEKRHDFIEKHSKEPQYEDMKNIDEETEKIIFNKYTFPYYLKTTENAIINKFLNINEIQTDEIVRQTFNLIINFIENKIYSKRTDMKWNEENKIYEYL